MTQTTHDRTVAWLAEYIQAHPADLMNFREIRNHMKTAGKVSSHVIFWITSFSMESFYMRHEN
jgi:hypothetical protein